MHECGHSETALDANRFTALLPFQGKDRHCDVPLDKRVLQGGDGLWEGCCHFPGTQQQGLRQASWSMLPPAGIFARALVPLPSCPCLHALGIVFVLVLVLVWGPALAI